MGNKDMFRTAVLGGYQKEDVLDYVRSLENENETIRVLTKKENSEIKAQLEREKTAGEEMRKTLAALQEKIRLLEEEKNNWQNRAPISETEKECENSDKVGKWRKEQEERELRLGKLLEEMRDSNEKLEQRFGQMEKYITLFAEALDGREAAKHQPKEPETMKFVPETNMPAFGPDTFVEDGIREETEVMQEDRPEDTTETVPSCTEPEQRKEAADMEEKETTVETETNAYARKAQESLQNTRGKIEKLLKALEDIQ